MNIYDFNVIDREGKEVNLGIYKGKVLLIVNSATHCGFTPQYEELQKLFEIYADQGFVILDFPCNQFRNQAPESVDEIHEFCKVNYGVTYPIHAKIEVNGENAHPLYKFLKQEKGFAGFDFSHPIASKLDSILSEDDPNYKDNPDIKWNFTKFLIDRNGNVVERFEPTTKIKVIEERIKELL